MNLWFTENISIVPGYRQSYQIERSIHSEVTPFQKLDILESSRYGRILLLDDVMMTTEFDEHVYHEMIAHVPLFAHPSPRKVLVIGGGDGGVIREVLKHPTVEEAHLCEIDERVVATCREHIPSIAGALGDPKVSLIYKDGVEWVNNHPDTYDVIIVDSTDPVGIAEGLFQFPFFEACHRALTQDGIMTNQAENHMVHSHIIRGMIESGRKLFPVSDYYSANVPTYPHGLIGFTFFSRKHTNTENLEAKLQHGDYLFIDTLKYWTPELQSAAFQLPARVKKTIFA